MVKSVISGREWRKEGEVLDLDPKTSAYYLKKGIAVEHKEVKAAPETKEAKAPKKRTTKKAK